MDSVAILVPAAGSSSRMRGRDKLMEEIDGVPLLLRTVGRALRTGCKVLVTVPQDRPGRVAALRTLDHPNLMIGPPLDAREGMSVSLRHGAGWASDAHPAPAGLMILLADMPDVTTQDIQTVLSAFVQAPDRVHRAVSQSGQPGHPVVFPRRLFRQLAEVTGDSGAREVMANEALVTVPLPGDHASTDLDTPEDWVAWRARHKS